MTKETVPMSQYRVHQEGDEITIQLNDGPHVKLQFAEAVALTHGLMDCVKGWCFDYDGKQVPK